ncbi:uncharacterized protein B0I36DRAFT_431244 [Microdochium trichocladiopsis]|uniref:Uncharacterized protein n=1 Tax=Microdochium trichocladiopsis TaxID=1682393 RepID=A0A9P8Y4J4_9PEZI|nr:uncharacterized protein B0I36DRAFT_431244 [Microdochium trichocladiopsis]KAH7031057.1 hypothetical protein B0I36DRAFT_431244 [Microdochium trichocladiopsis]
MSHSSGLSTCQPGESANHTGSQAPEVEIAKRRSAASNSARIPRTMPSEIAIARCPYQPSSAAGTPPPGNGLWPSTSWAPESFQMQPQVPVALQYQRASSSTGQGSRARCQEADTKDCSPPPTSSASHATGAGWSEQHQVQPCNNLNLKRQAADNENDHSPEGQASNSKNVHSLKRQASDSDNGRSLKRQASDSENVHQPQKREETSPRIFVLRASATELYNYETHLERDESTGRIKVLQQWADSEVSFHSLPGKTQMEFLHSVATIGKPVLDLLAKSPRYEAPGPYIRCKAYKIYPKIGQHGGPVCVCEVGSNRDSAWGSGPRQSRNYKAADDRGVWGGYLEC